MLEHKRIFWQFEVEGAFDEKSAEQKLLNATMEYYNEAAKEVQKVVRKVSKTNCKLQSFWPLISTVAAGKNLTK